MAGKKGMSSGIPDNKHAAKAPALRGVSAGRISAELMAMVKLRADATGQKARDVIEAALKEYFKP